MGGEAEREAVVRVPGGAAYIPRELLSDEQAMINHGQTVATLDKRGGLSAYEAACLIRGERLFPISLTTEEAWRVIFDAFRAAVLAADDA